MIGRLRCVQSIASALLLLCGCIGPGGLKKADPLSGSSWQLARIGEAEALAGVEVTLRLDEGQVSGSAGCNRYGGEYQVKGHALTCGPLESTLLACLDETTMAQEQRYLQVLGQASTWEWKGVTLYIYAADGQALVFAPVE